MSEIIKDLPKKRWTTSSPTTDQIQLGVMMNIADSLKNMEQPYLTLIRDLEWYRNRYEVVKQDLAKERKKNASLKGWITRLKKNTP
jgi:hypothetical protein